MQPDEMIFILLVKKSIYCRIIRSMNWPSWNSRHVLS